MGLMHTYHAIQNLIYYNIERWNLPKTPLESKVE